MRCATKYVSLLLLLLCGTAFAAPIVVERTEERSLRSAQNGVEYRLYIALPHGYRDASQRFPVVYLLDADYSFLIARNIADHLSERKQLREMILVGIAYDHGGPGQEVDQYHLNRTRDYTPLFWPDDGYGPEFQKVSGGGPKFRAFIESELIPYIDANYRTIAGDRCIVGHSYGGLFAASLLSSDAFSRYIIVSPSLWYARRWIFGQRITRRTPARVYLSVGANERNGGHDMVNDLMAFAKALRKNEHGLAIRAHVLDDETHNSVFPRALSNGLRFVFEGR